MTVKKETNPLFSICSPRSIAWYGASNRFTSMGTNMLASLQKFGFAGPIYPVHPKEDTVLGLTAYKSALDLPETPDLAVMVLPTGVVPQALEECGQKGIAGAIIVSGGFAEAGSPDGKQQQDRLLEIAEKYGMRFVGPNCLGVVNTHHKLNTTFLPCEGDPGFIGMASQSGSFITQMFDYLGGFGLGFSTGISVGNEASIDIVDCLEHLGSCAHTRVIALYIESIRRGRAFIRAARAIVPHKPIVAYYVGGSEGGRKAGLSHTGALAGPDRLYNGIFRQSGIIRARSIAELFDFCHVLGTCKLPAGNRIIIQTHSGGPGAVAADTCSREGLVLADLSPQTREGLASLVPHTGSVNNPVDLTFSKNPLDFFGEIPKILLDEENADGLLVYFLGNRYATMRALVGMGIPEDQVDEKAQELTGFQTDSIQKLAARSSRPLIGFTFCRPEDPLIRSLREKGIPVLPGPERAARAMAALNEYRVLREKILSFKLDPGF